MAHLTTNISDTMKDARHEMRHAPRDGSTILLQYWVRHHSARHDDFVRDGIVWRECRWIDDSKSSGSPSHWEPWGGSAHTRSSEHIDEVDCLGWIPVPSCQPELRRQAQVAAWDLVQRGVSENELFQRAARLNHAVRLVRAKRAANAAELYRCAPVEKRACSKFSATCPDCGGKMVGDGVTVVRHCENLDTSDLCLEPDATPRRCGGTT